MRVGNLLLACLALATGCAPPPKLRAPASPASSTTTWNDRSTPADSTKTNDPNQTLPTETLALDPTTSADDSTFEVIDELATGDAVPDISDSLAAATEARLTTFADAIDFPVTVNRRVLSWIDEYSGRSRRSFQASLFRSGRYMPRMREIFREEGVPQDLTFLAHVESGFRYNARSPARAVGLWQFMSGTARDFGLRVDSEIDERLDPEKSTRAAACYLRSLHQRYDDWHLALAAYNAGPGTVDRAIRICGTSDFWALSKQNQLKNETRNFVPAILAAAILSKSPGGFGLSEETDRPVESALIEVDLPTDLRVVALCAGCDLATVRALNPGLLKMCTPTGSYPVWLPANLAERARTGLAAIPADQRILYVEHSLKRGDTLGALARNYRTTVRAIQDANGMGKSTLLRVGRVLKIPAGGTTLNAELTRAESSPAAGDWSGSHRVLRGETLHAIARANGTTAALLAQRNGISDPRRLRAGQLLRVPSFGAMALNELPEGSSGRPQSPSPTSPGSALASALTPSGQPVHPQQDFAPSFPDAPVDPESLGRGPSIVHLVEQARAELAEATPEPVSPARSHRVERGDTLWSIARRHQVGVSDLRRWNGLGSKSTIHPGQVLRLY